MSSIYSNYIGKYIRYTILIIVVAVSGVPFIQAQTYFNSTHIPVFHQQFDQPALVGSISDIRLVGAFRYQWVGIEGAPMTMYAGADMQLPLKNISGGVFLSHDRAGAASHTQANISLAYGIPIQQNKISIGVKVGLTNLTLDGSKLTTPNQNTGVEDPTFSLQKESGIRPDIGIGVSYIHQFFHFGGFVYNLGDFKTSLNGINQNSEFTFGRYIGIGGAANIPLSKNFTLDPSLLLKTNTINHQIDLSLSTTYKEKYSLGVGYRGYNKTSNESLALISKINIAKSLFVMYSYDILFNRIKLASSGSHEVSLQYAFPKKFISNRNKIINHPRYL